MADSSDEPTVPIGPVVVRLDDDPSGDERPGVGAHARGAGAHHRREVGEADRDRDVRWHWLVALGVLTILVTSGLVWLFVSIPHPVPDRHQAAPNVASTDQLSIPDYSAPPQPTPTGGTAATAALPPSASATSVPTSSALRTPAPTNTPTASPSAPPLVVPQVVGKPQPAAEASLRSAGFTVAV